MVRVGANIPRGSNDPFVGYSCTTKEYSSENPKQKWASFCGVRKPACTLLCTESPLFSIGPEVLLGSQTSRIIPRLRRRTHRPCSAPPMEALGDGALQAAASAWPGPSRRRHLLRFLLHASKVLHATPAPPSPVSHYASPHPPFPRSASTSGPPSSTPRSISSPAASSPRSRGDPSTPPRPDSFLPPVSHLSRPGRRRGRKKGFCGATGRSVRSSWLLQPLRDSNLELFALVAVWIASKVATLLHQTPSYTGW
jgi:hypothetical protein